MKTRRSEHGRRLLSLLLAAVMLLGLLPPLASDAAAATDSSKLLDLDGKAPAALATAVNPYGYDPGVAFKLSVGNELLYWGGWNGDHESKGVNASDMDTLKRYMQGPNKSGERFTQPDGVWNWIQAVSFNAGNGRDDHILFIGLKGSDEYAYAWVLDRVENKISYELKLGRMDWINNDYEQFMSNSLFEVVAGDFDGDGVDSLLVYTPLDLNDDQSDGCTLWELTYKNGSLYKGDKQQQLLMDHYIQEQTAKTHKDSSDCKDAGRNKLVVDMVVGDFNWDCVDDLAVLSYSQNRDGSHSYEYYTPTLKICYGGSGDYTPDTTYQVAERSGSTQTFPMAASLAAGDFNGDRYDDLCVVGMQASWGSGWSNTSANSSQWYLQGYFGGTTMTTGTRATVQANEWTDDGYYENDDDIYPKLMTEAVAVNGGGHPEMLFISGSLYDMSNGTPTHKYTGSYFQSGDGGATEGGTSSAITNTFIQSVAVGNFDNNDAGREQVAITVGLKEAGQDDYWYHAFLFSGQSFVDTQYEDGSTCYGPASSYFCQASGYIHVNKGDNVNEGLACHLIAADYDNDGLTAKYLGAGYVYTDPTVRAVLQAAPYFGDIDTPGLNGTGYTLETDYSSSESSTLDVNGKLGFAFSAGVPLVCNINVSVGLQGGWSSTATKTLNQSYSETFMAGAYDSVIVHRIPMIIYKYDIMDENGEWRNQTAMEIPVAQEPVYENLSVDAYNAMAEEYNQMMEQAKVEYYPLKTIDLAANWLDGNEGNPYAYNQRDWATVGGTQISKSTYQLGKNGVLTSVTWTEGNSTEAATTTTFGFYINASILFGGEMGVAGGAEGGFEFNGTVGSATSTGNAIGNACTVEDLDGAALLASGLEQSVLDQYGFSWTFGKWTQDLGIRDDKGKTVPITFLGYSLSNVTSPPRPVTDLGGRAVDAGTIELSWSEPDTPQGWPSADSYILYQVLTDGGGNTSTQEVWRGTGTSVRLTSLAGTAVQPDTEYTFYVRSVHNYATDQGISAPSNLVVLRMPRPSYTVTLEYDPSVVTASMVRQSGTVIETGDAVEEGTIIQVSAQTKSEHDKILRLVVTDAATGQTTAIIPDEDGTSVTGYFQVKGAMAFRVVSKKDIKESQVTFAGTVMDGSTVQGTVTAKVGQRTLNAPGGYVADPVTFTAHPADGYVLTGWQVSLGDRTVVYPANNGHDLELPLLAEQMTVTAVFSPADEHLQTITLNPGEGGAIRLTNDRGEELVPAEDGACIVGYNTPVTFTAVPDTGYAFISWTGVQQTADTFTVPVTQDMTVGASFYAPVKYLLTYDAVDANGNQVTVDPYVASGSKLADGTRLTVNAAAAEDYRIAGMTVTQGERENPVVYQDLTTVCSEDLILRANTKIQVNFVPLEYYTVTVQQTGQGSVTLTGSQGDLASGDPVPYGSSVVLTATPAEGWELSSTDGWTYLSDGIYTRTLRQITADQTVDVTFTPLRSGHQNCICGGYQDITQDQWFHDEVVKAMELGLMQGTSHGRFQPYSQLTRAMMVQILYNLEGRPAVEITDAYTDVDAGRWYAKAISWATEESIVDGMGFGQFAPDTPVTREQMVTMLYRYARYKGMDVSAAGDLSPYTDADQIHNYAKAAMQWALAEGLIKGTSATTIAPRATALRCQAAAVLVRFIK